MFAWQSILFAQQRFPKPEFESGYDYPEVQLPDSRNPVMEYVDVAFLLAVLIFTTRASLVTRSRRSLIWISVFTLGYFGFYRLGCICSIGAIQNISLALFNESYSLPLSAVLFFMLPFIFALFYGRQFCAGACPLGAIQELTGLYPVRIPRVIEIILGSVPYIYLALSILFAATDSQFIICKYDPFVGIFRLNAPITMVVFGLLLLIAGVFVNRPYCRFLCPYGVILGWFSSFSSRHLSITPDKCINCILCENSCPYNAILPLTTDSVKEENRTSRKRFVTLLLLVPLFTLGGIILTKTFSDDLALVHRDVRLASEIRVEAESGMKATSQGAVTFKESGETLEELYAREEHIKGRFAKGSLWTGAFLGLALGLGLLSTAIRRERDEYIPDHGKCYSCGRCFEYCPVHIDKKST